MAKTITLYLMNNDADGIIKTSISSCTLLCYKIPRSMLENAKEISQLSHTGVYFLFGNDQVYVGQAGYRKYGPAILSRLLEHDKSPDKEFWTEAIVFTTTDDSLGPTEISYLENKFYNQSVSAHRYTVKNSNDPTPGNIKEEKKSEMDDFAANVQLVFGVLGYKVFTPAKHNSPIKVTPRTDNTETQTITPPSVITHNAKKPPLPEITTGTKIGSWIKAAMRALSKSGYEFSAPEIEMMTNPEWSKKVFKTSKPFMRIYKGEHTSITDEKGYTRFWKEPFTFGAHTVLISKEWYERDFEKFKDWYNSI